MSDPVYPVADQVGRKLYATEPGPAELEASRELVLELLDSYIRQMRNQVREHENLAVPCPPGRWRWADTNISGYGKKPEEELRVDRARHLVRAAGARTRLAIALATRRRVAAEGTL